jgi:hypothetical protein
MRASRISKPSFFSRMVIWALFMFPLLLVS